MLAGKDVGRGCPCSRVSVDLGLLVERFPANMFLAEHDVYIRLSMRVVAVVTGGEWSWCQSVLVKEVESYREAAWWKFHQGI